MFDDSSDPHHQAKELATVTRQSNAVIAIPNEIAAPTPQSAKPLLERQLLYFGDDPQPVKPPTDNSSAIMKNSSFYHVFSVAP